MRRRLSSKKGDGGLSSTMVMMTIALVGLFVLLLVTGQFGKLFKTVTGKSECQMQYLASSASKVNGIQIAEPTCEPHLVTIDKKYLDANRDRADKAINSYSNKYKDKFAYSKTFNEYTSYFLLSKENPEYTSRMNQWLIDEKLAKEMKYCWDITGHGKLDLFSNWQGMIQCVDKNDNTKTHPCDNSEMASIYAEHTYLEAVTGTAAAAFVGIKTKSFLFGGAAGALSAQASPLIFEWFAGNVKSGVFDPPPTFCAICARIKFENDINEKGSVGLWLQNTPVDDVGSLSKMSYAQYLENDNFKGMLIGPGSYEYTAPTTYAVVYARINTYQSEKLFMNALKGINSVVSSKDRFNATSDIQMIKLVPYQNLKNECTMLVG